MFIYRMIVVAGLLSISNGCALVTVPVKTVGKVAETTVKTTGSVVEAPFKAVGGGYNNGVVAPQETQKSATRGEQ